MTFAADDPGLTTEPTRAITPPSPVEPANVRPSPAEPANARRDPRSDAIPSPGRTRSMLRWLSAYTASDDPHVSATNTIALVIAWNQPYYPLYLWWIVGHDAWVAIPDAFSGILFFAIPATGRRSGILGRVAMIVFSVANVVFCSMMLGEAAGVQLLFLPCGMLAAILFTWRERYLMLAMTSLPLLAWLLTRGRLNIPPIPFSPDAYASLFTLNAVSSGALMVFFGWLLAGINRQVEQKGR